MPRPSFRSTAQVRVLQNAPIAEWFKLADFAGWGARVQHATMEGMERRGLLERRTDDQGFISWRFTKAGQIEAVQWKARGLGA